LQQRGDPSLADHVAGAKRHQHAYPPHRLALLRAGAFCCNALRRNWHFASIPAPLKFERYGRKADIRRSRWLR
jgi:hypothetical protein